MVSLDGATEGPIGAAEIGTSIVVRTGDTSSNLANALKSNS